jgi:hypothetical protein
LPQRVPYQCRVSAYVCGARYRYERSDTNLTILGGDVECRARGTTRRSYDKFHLGGAMSSTLNTKSLQYVSGTEVAHARALLSALQHTHAHAQTHPYTHA